MYDYVLLYIKEKDSITMTTFFVTKIAKSGTDANGNERRIIIIPTDRLREITKYCGKQVRVTIDDI